MSTLHLPKKNLSVSTNNAESRNRYQAIQVAGLVAPFVDALNRADNLDAVWAIPFSFEESVHPSHPTLKLSTVIKRAEQAAVIEHMRVDSLASARSALIKVSQYSDWTQRSYAPLLELLDIAIAGKRSKRVLS
ncbi:MAG: hypothetical protein V4858_22125 [Pseudomonadota bacterium]